jgi:Mrp family chromosome partitioning ATPase
MSRNFDVLRQLDLEAGEERPGNGASTAAAGAEPRSVSAPSTDLRCPPMPKSTATEIQKLVERLFLISGTGAPQTVVFTALQETKEPNVLCARAGQILALHSKASVCVVDANLHSPRMHEYFLIPNEVGLSNTMQLPEVMQIGHKSPGLDLTVITAGPKTSQWEAVLASDAMRARLNELRDRFDFVLIEAPPLSASTSAMLLGKLTDGVVMVVEANTTRREVARKAKNDFNACEVSLLGTVLNNRDFPVPEFIYAKL